MPLTAREKAILDFEGSWWTEPVAKDDAIRERFDFSPARYAGLLAALVDDADALVYDPLLVRRLRRMKDQRRRVRSEAHPANTRRPGR
jgi:Protein of unknown function (DUF3263)